ncbi:MAG: pyridoxamine 5'-phosphate oxidase family protein [Proteobacteria bacterium]|nr:pyridoxamine 5'-phosphate oxidase family protein [Pseudomonadota bacterium]
MAVRHLIAPTDRTRLARRKDRGSYDLATVHAILDEALYCHVGFSLEGQPYVIPTIHARRGEQLLLHGSVASRMLGTLATAIPLCVTVTLLDGLVLARSGFNHSMNYRSVVILATATEITTEADKRAALDALVNRVLPNRAAAVRAANRKELNATTVLALPIAEASAKVRTGPPHDDEDDLAMECWAGELPLTLTALQPVPDPHLRPGIPVPAELTQWSRRGTDGKS